ESLGCVQAMAKGASRQKSPFAGKLDLFFEAEISIVRSRKSDLHTLTEVVVKNPFPAIRSNYLPPRSAAYFVELIEICTERDHREPELFGLLRRAFGYLDANHPTARAVAHFETELARIAGVHDRTRLEADPAFALGNLFGRLPLSRTPLLKTLAMQAKETRRGKSELGWFGFRERFRLEPRRPRRVSAAARGRAGSNFVSRCCSLRSVLSLRR